MKGFALGLALKQRRKATRKSPIELRIIQPSTDGFLSIILVCGMKWYFPDVSFTSVTSELSLNFGFINKNISECKC